MMTYKIMSLSEVVPTEIGQETVSFDLFDTLIFRRYLRFDQVHDLASAYALAVLGCHGKERPADMTRARYSVTDALKSAPYRPVEEPPLALIWSRLVGARVGPGREADELGKRIAHFEYDVDRENLVLVAGACDLLAALKAAGKRIIAISDMYFSGEEIRAILAGLGILHFFDRVFVSSDERCTKQTARLFVLACNEIGVAPKDVIHFGDNKLSDVDIPSRLGILSVHVDHHAILPVEDLKLGRRADIHLEISDLIKLFIARIKFQTLNDDIEALYFLSRDGYIIHRVLESWSSSLIHGYFGAAPAEDLFISRAISCWLNVKFQSRWLLQALGHAFWLHLGTATPRQISAILGIEAVPPDLPERYYNNVTDTFTVLEAYERAGLAEPIREALLNKRSRAMRYFEDSGFLSHRRVAICDIGYSGTVARDLNTFFLQEAAEGFDRSIPRIVFHSLANNKNYAANAIVAQPHVHFPAQVILPNSEIPASLSESFAWLEMFFKHPTAGPLLGYLEKAGRMVPDYQQTGQVAEGHPFTRIVEHAGARSSDIVLLWMAAVENWTPFTEPLIQRFADPDDATIEQMLADVYEVDAVSGATRSVVLVAPDLSDEQVTAQAKARDYWIPGSIVASRRLRPEQAKPRAGGYTPGLAGKNNRLRSMLERLLSIRDLSDFDPIFYQEFYPDLREISSDDMLKEHYRIHGRLVGRYGSEAEFKKRTLSSLGELPLDFDYGEYLWANPDLVPFDPARWNAELHFLRNGREEGRKHRKATPILDREFDLLVADGRLALDAAERSAWQAGMPVRTILFARHRVGAGPWMDMLDLAEFVALNFTWCGMLETRAAAILAFLEKGMAILAPLSLATAFDPSFYRSQYRGLDKLSDVEVYRHWIATGSLKGYAPSEEARLRALIDEPIFPNAYHAEAFRQRHAGKLLGWRTRCDLLEAFLDWGELDRDDVVYGDGAASVWLAVSRRAAASNKLDRARSACLRALEAGGPPGRIWHWLGDLYREKGLNDEAIQAYLKGIAGATPNRWSYLNGIAAACDIGAFETGLRLMTTGADVWKETEPWRRARSLLFQRWFDEGFEEACRPHASDANAVGRPRSDRATAFVRRVAETAALTLPKCLSLARVTGTTVLLSRRTLTHQALAAINDRPLAADAGAARPHVFSRTDVVAFSENLIGASLAIIHEVEVDSFVIDAILLARAYGVPTVFWAGALGRIPRPIKGLQDNLSLSDLAFDDYMSHSSDPSSDTNFRSLQAAALCDSIVTTAPSLIPSLRALSRDGEVLFANTRALDAAKSLRRSRSSAVRVLASVRGLAIGSPELLVVYRGLAAMLDKHDGVELLLDGSSGAEPLLAPFFGRVVGFVDAMTLDQRIMIAGTVDVVVDLSGAEPAFRDWWPDAAFHEVPVIASADRAVDLTDRLDGLKVAVIADFASLLDELVERPDLRMTLGSAANTRLQQLCLANGFPKRSELDCIGKTVKRRILYANLFAPPQVIGGATRVLADNLHTMIETGSEKYDFAILASDDDNPSLGAIRCDNWRGAPVFRIATPQELDMDWRGYNAQVDGFARKVLALTEPDLVHIHCLPRLGVGVADACRAAGRPYVITLHDGWWLSDFPFLVDEDGRVSAVASDPMRQSWSRRLGLPRSIERAARLRATLEGAEALLSVSEAFAGIYREAGFAVETIANGVSDIRPLPKLPGSGRVRLGHIGGTQHHKGAYLVEAVLRTNSFDHLELTIVELGRDPADIVHTVWGSTPVTIIGKTPADQIAALYSRIDVLLAPSIWPESFGLVSREALASGLWVVASDQGAMGEDVVPGKNGFIIDVRTPEGLLNILRTIEADPARYAEAPSHTPTLRTATDQGRDLIAFYDRLLSA